ncbi:hypothetical protein [Deinococcus frigens]|nr:hypothetical protein [Deinococcus frigens]
MPVKQRVQERGTMVCTLRCTLAIIPNPIPSIAASKPATLST